MPKRRSYRKASAHVIDDCKTRQNEVDCDKLDSLISDEEFVTLFFETPQEAIDLLVRLAKDYGVRNINAVRKWGIVAIHSSPTDLDLALLRLVLNKRVAFTVEEGELLFELGERSLYTLN